MMLEADWLTKRTADIWRYLYTTWSRQLQ